MNAFRNTVVGLCLLLGGLSATAQSFDVVSVMTYNLLYYRGTTGQCNGTTNSINTKEAAMRTIINHTTPDILVCNEIGASFINSFRLLTNSLNQNGRSNYQLANYTANSFQNLTNMLYYNTEKFVLKRQDEITQNLDNTSIVRLIDVYELYYNDSLLSINQDTAFLTVFAAHLKAGNTSSDRTDRGKAAAAIMDYIDNNNISGNVILAGDLNLYTATEPAFLSFVNHSTASNRFYDPVNQVGSWSNNSSFSSVHTQSTRTSSNTNGGCFAGGGMDDRFDFLLVSDEIINNSARMEYINNSYSALGQDGSRFNATIDSPNNFSAPANVIQALYDMSDHLPVSLVMRVYASTVTSINEQVLQHWRVTNPVDGELIIQSDKDADDLNVIELYDYSGRMLRQEKVHKANRYQIEVSDIPAGSYLLKLTARDGKQSVRKLIII